MCVLTSVWQCVQDLETCFACMNAEPNVKLKRNCSDTDIVTGERLPANEMCNMCYCRPMWCVDCLAKWFASRQDPDEKGVWLQQKCSCPMCRALFCLSDVCMIVKN